jgi:dTDP-4-amino-4,6-dideoxy-D-galactose acyltransferase
MRAVNGAAVPAFLLEWDSEFWGLTVARISGDTLTDEEWAVVDAWARSHHVDCLYFLARADDPGSIGVAQAAAFRLVDVRVELLWESTEVARQERIRTYRRDDLERLRTIARTRHENTRFYKDGSFPRERCADLYDTWIVRSCEENWADVVLVADHEHRASGYVTCHLDAVSGVGSIGLIAVAADAGSKGLGGELVLGALGWFREHGVDKISVVTQGANIGAQRLFQRCGFRSSSTGLWFHRWYG